MPCPERKIHRPTTLPMSSSITTGFSSRETILVSLLASVLAIYMFLQLGLLDSALEILEADLALDGFGSFVLMQEDVVSEQSVSAALGS